MQCYYCEKKLSRKLRCVLAFYWIVCWNVVKIWLITCTDFIRFSAFWVILLCIFCSNWNWNHKQITTWLAWQANLWKIGILIVIFSIFILKYWRTLIKRSIHGEGNKEKDGVAYILTRNRRYPQMCILYYLYDYHGVLFYRVSKLKCLYLKMKYFG